jgi:hypothetical protein
MESYSVWECGKQTVPFLSDILVKLHRAVLNLGLTDRSYAQSGHKDMQLNWSVCTRTTSYLHASVIVGHHQPLGMWRSVIVHDHHWAGFMNHKENS